MKKRWNTRSLSQTITSLLLSLLLFGFLWIAESSREIHLPAVGQPTELYANQNRDDLRQTYSGAISRAKKSVLFIIYAMSDEKVISSLKDKSEEGVDVQVICDAKACIKLKEKLGPKVDVFKRYGNGLMHLKILVIDNEEVWIGSANMTGESLRMHSNLVMAVSNPDLAKMVQSKAECLRSTSKSSPILHHAFDLEGQNGELWFLPDNRDAVNKLKELIRSAKKTMRIAMFTWTRSDLAQEVIQAANRGVDVQVIMDRSSAQAASSKIANMLKKTNISLFFNQGSGLLHHKFLYIDETLLVNGSANWTKAAFTQNDDCFMILNDLTDQQKGYMDDLWSIMISEAKK